MGLTNTEYPFWLCLLVPELIINQSFVCVYKVWMHYSYILESNSFYLSHHASFQLNPRKVPELSAVSRSVLFCSYWCREITALYDSFVNRVRRLAAPFLANQKKLSFCESFCTFVFTDIKLSDLSLNGRVLDREAVRLKK